MPRPHSQLQMTQNPASCDSPFPSKPKARSSVTAPSPHSSPTSLSPAPQSPFPALQTAERTLYPPDPFTNEYSPASPGSATSYSRNPSITEKHPVQMPSPTYSQSSRAEQAILSRDVNSRSGIMYSDQYKDRGGSVGSAVHMSPEYIYQRQDDVDVDEDKMSDHAVWLLFWLSFLLPAFCLFAAIYSFLAILALVLISPLQFCGVVRCLSANIERFLSPLWRTHLRSVHSDRIHDDFEPRTRPAILVFIHLISPLLSVGVALSAWLAASFWLFAAIMGNPDGTERGSDGRNTVVLVRDWWEKWLLKAEKVR